MAIKKRIKILIIDDDEVQIFMYRGKFELEGFAVISAINGIEGIKMAEKEQPNLIFLDIIMSKLDGLETLKKLKESVNANNIPVVMLTNLEKKGLVEKVHSLGAVDYIIKSQVVPSELVERAREILEVR